MVRRPDRSPQTLALLEAFAAHPGEWLYGYDLSKTTRLQSGTLYPILKRLTERGLLEEQWEKEPPGGKPPRHLYRLSQAGLVVAQEALAAPDAAIDEARPF